MEHFYKKLNNASTGDQFGYSVAIYNSQIIVGAPSSVYSNSAVYIFILSSNGEFVQAVKLTVSTGYIGYSIALYGEVALLTNTVNNAIGSVYYINNITGLETSLAENTNVFPAAYFAVVIILVSIVYIIVVMRFMFRRNYLLGKFRYNNQPQRQVNEMVAMGNPPPYLPANVTVHIYSTDGGSQAVQQNLPSGCDYCYFLIFLFFFVSIICLIIVSAACRAPEQNNLLGITWLSGNAGCGFSVIMASPFLLLMVLPVLCCSSLCSCTCCACSCCYCPCSCNCCPSCNCPCNCPNTDCSTNCSNTNCSNTNCSNCCGTNNNCCCCDNSSSTSSSSSSSCDCCTNSTTTNSTTAQ